jgi:hypothetical protein
MHKTLGIIATAAVSLSPVETRGQWPVRSTPGLGCAGFPAVNNGAAPWDRFRVGGVPRINRPANLRII